MPIVITDIPLAARRPCGLPNIFKVRENKDLFVISYEPNPETCFHVDMDASGAHGLGATKNIEIARKNLGGYVFECEHPGAYDGMLKRRVASGWVIPVKDLPLWDRYRFLTGDC